jgi:hypothetical protein
MPMRPALVLLASLISSGCASSTAPLEARVHDLELQVAELRGEVKAQANTDVMALRAGLSGSPCARTLPAPSIPDVAQMTTAVPFDLGQTSKQGGDRITITEVRGTRGDFALGGSYIVRGEYTLASADQADLAFNITAIDPADGCGYTNPRQHQRVTRGTGTFEVANTLTIRGYPHVTLYVRGSGTSGVYFGKGEFLQP